MIGHLMDDVHRLHGRSSARLLLQSLVLKRTFRPIVTARLLQWAAQKPARGLLCPPLLLLHAFFRWVAKVDFPHQASLGRGLRIDHGWGLVINASARIGDNVTLYHGVTLGQSDHVDADGQRSTRHPVIEDDVWIGPHAIVVGARVGKGSRIAGGAFVNRDVPPGSLVVGNPAQVVRSGVVPDVEHPVGEAWRR